MVLRGWAIGTGAPPAGPSVAPAGGVEQGMARCRKRAKPTPLAYHFAVAGAAGQ